MSSGWSLSVYPAACRHHGCASQTPGNNPNMVIYGRAVQETLEMFGIDATGQTMVTDRILFSPNGAGG